MSTQTLVERLYSNANDWQVEANRSLMEEAADRITELEAAITKTLNENGHLADGDNCTLIELKRIMGDRS